MIDDAQLATRLDGFLATRGVTRDGLLASLDEPFGRPLLVVAAGSILQGVGNARSDLDLIIVVERKVSRLPLASFAHSVLVDPVYFGVAEVEDWIPSLRDAAWPPVGGVDLDHWGRRCEQLLHATRFAYGLTLLARDGWDRWAMAFRDNWLVEQVCRWWRVEAMRRRCAARWLVDGKPMLAAQRWMDAVLAMLECRAAAAGQFFFAPKWLSEKFRILGDDWGLGTLRTIMRGPTRARDVPAFGRCCESLLADAGLGDDEAMVASVSYLPGVDADQHDGRTVVRRGNLRRVALDAPLQGDAGKLWQGSVAMLPPPAILRLFAADLTWLCVGARAA